MRLQPQRRYQAQQLLRRIGLHEVIVEADYLRENLVNRVFVLAARPEFELMAANDLSDGGIFNSGFALAGGRMYIRSDKFLYCIGKK